MTAHARARITCPQCHETFIDTDMREWMDAGRTPDEFHDAMKRLVNAHNDTCKPRPPAYSKEMRRGRLLWRLGTWFPAGWFTLTGVAYALGVLPLNALLGWSLMASGLCLFIAANREHYNYRNGYVRGRYSGEYGQPYMLSRWLHPGDGRHDPADQPPQFAEPEEEP
jgi:hypothetical protein